MISPFASSSSSAALAPAPPSAAHERISRARPLSPTPTTSTLGLGLGLAPRAQAAVTPRNRSPPSPLRHALSDPLDGAGAPASASGSDSEGECSKRARTAVVEAQAGMPGSPRAGAGSVPRTPSGLALSALAQEGRLGEDERIGAEAAEHAGEPSSIKKASNGLSTSNNIAAAPAAPVPAASHAAALPAPRKPHFPHSRPLRPLTLSSTLAPHAGTTSAARKSSQQQRQKLIVPSGGWKGCFTLNLTQAELARTD